MGHAAIPITLFIPGIKAFTGEERAFIEKNFPDTANVEGGKFIYDGNSTNYYISRAKNEKAVAVGITGLNAHFVLNPQEVKRLNEEENITFVWMVLPRAVPGKSFMAGYEKLCRAFLTDPRSPSRTLTDPAKPHYIVTHSTSGPILTSLMHEDPTRRKLNATFSGAAMVSPFFDVPYASRDHSSKLLHKIFTWYSAHHKNDRACDLPIARLYLSIAAAKESFINAHTDLPTTAGKIMETVDNAARDTIQTAGKIVSSTDNRVLLSLLMSTTLKASEGLVFAKKLLFPQKNDSDFFPTFGQIEEITTYGRNMIDRLNPDAMRSLPGIIIAGDKDAFTDYKTSRAVAAKMGMDFHLVQGGSHDPLKDSPSSLNVLLKKLNDCQENFARAQVETIVVPSRWTEPPMEQIDLPPLPLRHRAGDALQRGASFLYPATSLF